MGLLKAFVEVAYNLLFVHVLADEDYLFACGLRIFSSQSRISPGS